MPGIRPQARARLAARRFALAVSALLRRSFAVVLALACASAPPVGHDAVSAVEIRGGDIANDPALEEGLATQEDAVFDQDVLEKDLERVRRFYRSHGYYEAQVRAARV